MNFLLLPCANKYMMMMIAPHCEKLAYKVLRHGSHSFTLQTHHICVHFVSVHQTAPPLTIVIAAIWLQLTTHLSTQDHNLLPY